MFQAQYLFKDNAVWSPWLDRQGDNITISADFIKVNVSATSPALTIQVWTKSRETTGDGSQMTGSLEINSAGQDSADFSGCNEMVRYKMTVTTTSTNDYDYILFRMLSPVWFDDVAV